MVSDSGLACRVCRAGALQLSITGRYPLMAEFELGLLRQRAREAFEQKIQRGHALWELPVGFVRTEEDLVEKIADRQVQEAIASVFRKFREFGSARLGIPAELEHGIRRKWNVDSGGSGTSIPAEVEHRFREVEHGFREVEHRFRRKWNRGSGGRERSSVA